MPAARPKPRYLVIEFEAQPTQDTVAGAVEIARKAHEQNRFKGYAVVELVAIVASEHKTVVTRVK